MQTLRVTCACGCGTEIAARDAKNRPRRYAHGHNRRRHADPRRPDAEVGWRNRHARSAALVPPGPCAWEHIGGCSTGTMTHVAHVNGDDSDNRPSNLLRLCPSHHGLLDRGRIDPKDPVMPPFTVSSGKRRYGRRAA